MTRPLILARMVWIESIRRKDAYVLGILLAGLTMYLASADVFGLSGTARYVLDLGLGAAWLFGFLFVIPFAARQLPAEESRGTIQAVLSKPVGRGELVLGKWIGVTASGLVAAAALYAVALGASAARGGAVPAAAALFQSAVLHAAAIGMASALALALSTRLTAGAAMTLSGLIVMASLALLPAAPRVAALSDPIRARALLAVYHALPHFGLFDLRARLVHDWGPMPWAVWGELLAYAAGWTAFLLGLAWAGYARKTFQRGQVR